MQSPFIDFICKVGMTGLCVFLFIYLICITIDLVKFLSGKYPERKEKIHYDKDDDSDLGIFMQ